jgi:hypothetical protein
MKPLYLELESLIENKICPVHNQKATANNSNGNIILICCCADFETECYNEIIARFQADYTEQKKYDL